MQFQKDLDSAKHVNSKVEIVNAGNNNNNINNLNYLKPSAKNDKSREGPRDKKGNNRPGSKNDNPRDLGEKEKKMRDSERDAKGYVRGNDRSREDEEVIEDSAEEEDFDSCSCVTCNTCHQSDCSCSEMSSESQASR